MKIKGKAVERERRSRCKNTSERKDSNRSVMVILVFHMQKLHFLDLRLSYLGFLCAS
jgi:hypothetical protein